MTTRSSLTHKELIDLLEYRAETGQFYWRKSRGSNCKIGLPAGHLRKTGYVAIVVSGVLYMAHRLAWFYVYKSWPTSCVDHINGDPSDNRLSNLRVVSMRTNSENRHRAHKHNTSGLLGAHKCTRKCGIRWESRIVVNGRRVFLGRYKTPEEAHARYIEAKRNLHAGCVI